MSFVKCLDCGGAVYTRTESRKVMRVTWETGDRMVDEIVTRKYNCLGCGAPAMGRWDAWCDMMDWLEKMLGEVMRRIGGEVVGKFRRRGLGKGWDENGGGSVVGLGENVD